MHKQHIINAFIQKFDYKSYLEIGIENGNHFKSINCKAKLGVDPDPRSAADIKETSDEFFRLNKKTFDIILIDGLHHRDQVSTDAQNSLQILNKNGTIILHDCMPYTEPMQVVPRIAKEWTGDVWKAWVLMRSRTDFFMFVIDTDYGVGIIRKIDPDYPKDENKVLLVEEEELKWENFFNKFKEWLNLISVNDFIDWLNSAPILVSA